MLHFHVMNAVAIRDHLGSIQDIECSCRVIWMSGALQNAAETEGHDGDAIEFGSIGALPPPFGGWAGGDCGTDKKFTAFHHGYLMNSDQCTVTTALQTACELV